MKSRLLNFSSRVWPSSGTAASARSLPWFVRGDVDGFFGLFIDNLLQLMLIMFLCRYACGIPSEFINGRILPGAAVSILAGNFLYAVQARRLAAKTGRTDVTALPFGINTVSLLAFVFLVMAPVYYETEDADLAWKVGLAACFISGIIETAGAFCGGWLKRNTPRTALLSGLAGVALSFMALGFSFQIFSSPAIAILPMMLILIVYGGRVKLPLKLPGGLMAVLVGVGAAWTLKSFGLSNFAVPEDPVTLGWNVPAPAVTELVSIITQPSAWAYVAVIVPIGLFNIIGSIENLESAEAAGDRFDTKKSLLINGVTSLLAGALGSPFPTSIYIGHPGWKAMGARTGYSILNGAVITVLCLIGGITAVLKIVPLEATLGILIWIGVVIAAQAFQETERRHATAVVVGLIPSLAAWVLHVIEASLRAVGTNLYDSFERFGDELYIQGIISLYQGFLLIAIIFSALMTYIIDRQFLKAAAWSLVASALSATGMIHAYQLTPSGIHMALGWLTAPVYTAVYAVLAFVFLALHVGSAEPQGLSPLK